jgi:FAD/FMN-containing dehydrogenase/Fe-S oxidoreductase
MLPVLDPKSTLTHVYVDYLDALKASDFSGDIESTYSSRLAVATDNSIYQQLPQAVVFPKTIEDLSVLGQLANTHSGVTFSARGGGTGTNGQSLTQGIVVDMSRHMRAILEINTEESWVRVQSGVVKDQLNDFLKPYGFFFAPDLSTSNRATIGGMINTDASGQGSLVYGKTSDHVLGLVSVLADGTVMQTQQQAMDTVVSEASESIARIVQQLKDTCVGKRSQILEKFPRLNRFLTGYDLEHAVNDDLTQLDISRVLAGSEGSLAFIAEAKLNVTRIPNHKVLLNIKYDSFESALRHAPDMVAAEATSVETVDSKVLNLAREDIVWHSVSALIQDVPGKDLQGLNMVEYNNEDKTEIDNKIVQLCHTLDQQIASGENGVIGYQLTYDTKEIGKIYAMRKKAVGLLGKAKGPQKPIAFAEDTAVPPENLADFIMEFRSLLDEQGLQYGMFGHVDAGVLHVRPALDMCDPAQEVLMKDISDQVVKLVAKYGGLMWGEHGKGYRSEYAPAFFGDELYAEIQKVKAAFDPHNKMNPGKICTPWQSNAQMVKVTDTKRGAFDRQIPIEVRDGYVPAMSCNGNGLCFNYDTTSPMCPSSKITRDRRHSPKGRAGMMREWLRLLSEQGVNPLKLESHSYSPSILSRLKNTLKKSKEEDFSHEVLEVMEGCLACKACANQCPINVDVPSFRARFLSLYYKRYLRPAKDHLVSNIEKMAPLLAKMPKAVNFFLEKSWLNDAIKKSIGYVDTPHLSIPTLSHRLPYTGAVEFDLSALKTLSEEERQSYVLLVQDTFTSYYEADLVADILKLIKHLGFTPVLLPFLPNGKPQHVKGFLAEFAKTAKSTAEFLNEVAGLGIPMVGVDPSLTLCFRDEYHKALKQSDVQFTVSLLQEWLSEAELPEVKVNSSHDFAFFAHCTEKTVVPKSETMWQSVFEQFGLNLQPIAVGCCGMAGTFGHEADHLDESVGIYDLSWRQRLQQFDKQSILATGYSCRSQVKRLDGYKPQHPAQALLRALS